MSWKFIWLCVILESMRSVGGIPHSAPAPRSRHRGGRARFDSQTLLTFFGFGLSCRRFDSNAFTHEDARINGDFSQYTGTSMPPRIVVRSRRTNAPTRSFTINIQIMFTGFSVCNGLHHSNCVKIRAVSLCPFEWPQRLPPMRPGALLPRVVFVSRP
jgi:hypothetical protein